MPPSHSVEAVVGLPRPWLRLFSMTEVACGPTSWGWACALIAGLLLGEVLIDWLPVPDLTQTPGRAISVLGPQFSGTSAGTTPPSTAESPAATATTTADIKPTPPNRPASLVRLVRRWRNDRPPSWAAEQLVHPLLYPLACWQRFLGDWWNWRQFLQALLATAGSLFVGVFLARRAALWHQPEDRTSIDRQWLFARDHCWPAVSAILVPLGAVCCLTTSLAVLSVFGRANWIGSALMVLLVPILVVMAAIAASLLGVVMIAGPLMIASVAADRVDGFGALSRVYNYLLLRPWGFLACVGIWFATGLVIVLLGDLFAQLTWAVLEQSLSVGLGAQQAGEWAALIPGRQVILQGLATSYLWSGAAVIYIILREQCDQTPSTMIAPHQDDPVTSPLIAGPLVGVAAKPENFHPELLPLNSAHSDRG